MGNDMERAAGFGWSRILFSWPGMSIIFGTLAVFFGQIEFHTERPPAALGISDHNEDFYLRVEARAWQDPFASLSGANVLKTLGGLSNLLHHSRETLTILSNEVHVALAGNNRISGSNSVSVMAVVTSGNQFERGAEMRRRTRVAVQSAMWSMGLAHRNSSRLGYFALPNLEEAFNHAALTVDPHPVPPKLIPFEWFFPDNSTLSTDHPWNGVLVLWLREDYLEARPFKRLAMTLSQLLSTRKEDNGGIQFSIIGPRSSDGLRAMAEDRSLAEACCRDPRFDHAKSLLRSGQILSSSATAPDPFVLTNHPPRSENRAMRDRVRDRLRQNLGSQVRFQHLGATDAELCYMLLAELTLRGVDVEKDNIVLVSEYDTLYGRQLPLTFQATVASLDSNQGLLSARQRSVNRLAEAILESQSTSHTNRVYSQLLNSFEAKLEGIRGRESAPSNLLHFSYLAGLDGTIPASHDRSDQHASDSTAPVASGQRSRGDQQLDYLRRLADDLSKYSLTRKVKAVGLLGGDYYDKLLILQALRRSLPHCVFFTTDLDARMMSVKDPRWTRNLITASGFDIKLPYEVAGKRLPRFRDGYQTGIFLACRQALLDSDKDMKMTSDIGVYEIGRSVPFRLDMTQTQKRPSGRSFNVKELLASWKYRLGQFPQYLVRIPAFAFGCLCFAIILLMVFPVRIVTGKGLVRLLGVILLWVVVVGSGLCLVFKSRFEPLEFGHGVSVLSSAILMTLAVSLVCVGFWYIGKLFDETVILPSAVGHYLIPFFLGLLAVLIFMEVDIPMRGTKEPVFRILMILVWFLAAGFTGFVLLIWRTLLKEALVIRQDAEGMAVAAWKSLFERSLDLARHSRACGGIQVYAVVILLLLTLAHSSWLDAWVWTPWMVALVVLLIGLLILLQVLLTRAASSIYHRLGMLLVESQSQDNTGEEEAVESEDQRALLEHLNFGCFAPPSRQPLFGALGTAVGGSGLATLIHLLLATT